MRFSSRLPHELQANALSLIRLAKERAGTPIFDLTESNPTRAGIVYPENFLRALADPRATIYEPEPFGLPAARETIAREYGAPVDRVVMTASTSEAYAWLFKLLCDPGDNVLVPRPSYPLFEYLAALESVDVRHYNLFHDHGAWNIDFHALEESITERTRAIVVVNPNNPTGNFIRRHEAEQLATLAAARGIALISDEVFCDYTLALSPESLPTLRDAGNALIFTLNGLSKAVGLPQMKLAWMIASGPDAIVNEALSRLEMIADTYLSAGTPVQCALPALLELRAPVQKQIIARLRANLAFLRSSGLRVGEVEAGWYAIVNHAHGEDFAEELLRGRDVLVQPGYFYDFENSNSLVLSLLTAPETFREGVTRLHAQLAQNLH